MLQHIRENLTGTFALVILGVIGFSFIFFGLNYSFIGSTYAAKVDGEEVSPGAFEARYRDAIQANPQLASADGPLREQIRRQLLDQLIVDQLIENYLNDRGYRISDEQVMRRIQETPDFQQNGVFDMETYRLTIAAQGRTPTDYEALLRRSMRQEQLQLAIAATALVTPAEYRRYLNLFAEQRVVTVASIAEDDVAATIAITDDMITAYYEDNPTLYQLPESADIEYIELRRDEVAEQVEVSEDEIRALYDGSRDRYLQDEQRQARHILVLFGDDEATAEATANEIRARVDAGESFEELAAELSADTLTAQQGGDFGPQSRDWFEPELASEIFSMNAGELAGPVRSQFGFHVLRLDQVLEPGPLPYDQVRAELLGELRENEADALYLDLERRVSDAMFDLSDMQAIGETVGLEVKTIAGFTRAGGGEIGNNQAAIDAVFDELVLTGGQISEIVELDANSAVVFKVAQYNEPVRQPLADVRDQVEAALRSQQAETIMVDRAEQMLAAVNGGEDFGVAADAAGMNLAEPQLVGRADQTIDQSLLFEVFAAGKPTPESPVVGRVRNLQGGYSVYSLDAVLPGRPESIPLSQRDQGKLQLAQQSGFGDLQAFVKSLYDEADIVINEDVVTAGGLF